MEPVRSSGGVRPCEMNSEALSAEALRAYIFRHRDFALKIGSFGFFRMLYVIRLDRGGSVHAVTLVIVVALLYC